MLIHRGEIAADRFTTISNDAVRDSRLTLRARGLLAYLLSNREGWSITSEALCAEMQEGRDAIRNCLKELERFGYLSRERAKGHGSRWQHNATITDVPIKDGISGVDQAATRFSTETPIKDGISGADGSINDWISVDGKSGDKRKNTNLEEKGNFSTGSSDIEAVPDVSEVLPDLRAALRPKVRA